MDRGYFHDVKNCILTDVFQLVEKNNWTSTIIVQKCVHTRSKVAEQQIQHGMRAVLLIVPSENA